MPQTVLHPAASAPLQGDALLSFIDNALEQLFTHSHSASISDQDRAHALAELLQQQSFAPQTLDELERLHSAWLHAQQAPAALACIETHSAHVLAHLEGVALSLAQASLAIAKAQALSRYDRSAAHLALQSAIAPMQQLQEEDLTSIYQQWLSWVEHCQAYALAEATADAMAARLDPHGEADFGSLVQPLVDKARWAMAQGHMDTALLHGQAAVDRMAQLHKHDTQPGFDDWAQLGESLQQTVPASVAHWAAVSHAHLQRTEAVAASAAVQKHRAIYAARMQALACAQLGDQTQAIAFGRQARYELSRFEGDEFVATWMEWLLEAGLLDELAPIAMDSAFHSRPASLQVAWKVAQACIDTDVTHRSTWACILAWCCMDRDCRERVPAPPHPAQHYLDMVLAQSPNDGLVTLMKGLQLARSRKQWSEALPLLEAGCAQQPHLCNSEVVLMLWAARFHVHGEAALQLPPPAAPSGAWNYAVGVSLDDDDELKPYMGGKKNLPAQELRQALVQHYYQQGHAHFEQFWHTGQGGFKDADIHIYSMLCNNLAIKLRHSEDYVPAIALHEQGLSTSPFAEHLHGLLWCYIMPDDYPGIARTAESLWHFAREHGYGRHTPYKYFNWVAEALYHLDRSAEISIWLERLELWWQEEADPEDAQERHDYLECLLIMLDFISTEHAHLVAPRLPALMQEVQPQPHIVLQCRMGRILMDCGQHAQALPFLQAAVQLIPAADNDFEAERAQEDLERCQTHLDAPAPQGKPWWKLW